MRSRRSIACSILALLELVAVTTTACDSNSSRAATANTPAITSVSGDLRLVAIGDSIPFNSPDDCAGCTGFVDQYAKAVGTATHRPVTVTNLSQHNNLTLPGLLGEIEDFHTALAGADIILVGIAHNSNELNLDQPCGKPLRNEMPDWTAMTRQCATTSADAAQVQYDKLYSLIAGWRNGKPTILRTINRYNDWIGWSKVSLTPGQYRQTALFVTTWSRAICQSARRNAFGCADLSTAFNGPDGLKPSGDLLGDDYTHPSQKGNDKIAATLERLGFILHT